MFKNIYIYIYILISVQKEPPRKNQKTNDSLKKLVLFLNYSKNCLSFYYAKCS